MSISLKRIALADLQMLADGGVPATARNGTAVDALPPPFVAARSLAQLQQGKPSQWCSTFYILSDDPAVDLPVDASANVSAEGAPRIVGSCGFKDVPVNGRVEIGYGVSPACQRRGVATAAVTELARIAFASGQVRELLAQVNRDNLASTRVVQKLQFKRHGQIVDTDGELLYQWILVAAQTLHEALIAQISNPTEGQE